MLQKEPRTFHSNQGMLETNERFSRRLYLAHDCPTLLSYFLLPTSYYQEGDSEGTAQNLHSSVLFGEAWPLYTNLVVLLLLVNQYIESIDTSTLGPAVIRYHQATYLGRSDGPRYQRSLVTLYF